MRKCYIFPPIKPDFYPLESEFSISGNQSEWHTLWGLFTL